MTQLLDTSILAASRWPDTDVPAAVSVVSIGELQAGVLMANTELERARRVQRLTLVLSSYATLPIDEAVAGSYGELRAASGRQPSNDLWIAATALAHRYTLLTADQRLAALPLVETELL